MKDKWLPKRFETKKERRLKEMRKNGRIGERD